MPIPLIAQACPPMLTILYRDQHYIAVDKPPGMLVHRTWISDGSEFVLQKLRDQIGRRVYPVHRLDRPTSGVLIFGLSSAAARRLCGTFTERETDKRYLAVVRGHCDEEGVIDYPLQEEEHKAAQEALTRYRTLARTELPIPIGRYPVARYSLVEARPVTGRMHQLRKHFKHIFHPMVGDTTYGEGRHNRLFRDHFGVSRLLLLAYSLGFVHPYSGEPTHIIAPLSEELRRLFDSLGWSGQLPQELIADPAAPAASVPDAP